MSSRLDVSTPDGRSLEVVLEGPDDGDLLVFHHGTPGAAVAHPALVRAGADRGLRTLFYSRPGYGTSTPTPGRTVADVAADTATLLDHLGADRFWTLGWSGGGPHALACAALLPGRCRGAAVVAGVAPHAAQDGGLGEEWTAGMGEANVEEFAAAAAGAEELEALLAGFDRSEITREGVLEDLKSLLSPVDVAAFTGELADFMVEGMRHAMLRGSDGWRDDDLAFMSPWGFDVKGITTPLLVTQGDADLMVPTRHGDWLASHLADAEVVRPGGQGHLSLMTDPAPIVDRLLRLG